MDLATVSSPLDAFGFSYHGPQVPLSETTDISLLESVIGNQTLILKTVYNTTDISVIPQIWTLCQFQLIAVPFFYDRLWLFFIYKDKEVEGYYEDGMRVPDYVTLLWTDDKYVGVIDLKLLY